MNSSALALVAFVFIFGSTLLGMALRKIMPEHQLSENTKDAVKLGTGLIATLAALVLGLLIASAKGTFDTMTNELRVMASLGVPILRAHQRLPRNWINPKNNYGW